MTDPRSGTPVRERWVEPRLRGIAVTHDQRNPPAPAGEFLPVDFALVGIKPVA